VAGASFHQVPRFSSAAARRRYREARRKRYLRRRMLVLSLLLVLLTGLYFALDWLLTRLAGPGQS
jgi:hypothetical protein